MVQSLALFTRAKKSQHLNGQLLTTSQICLKAASQAWQAHLLADPLRALLGIMNHQCSLPTNRALRSVTRAER